MRRLRKKGMSFERRRMLVGILFCSPFLIGFLMFFLSPMVQSIRYAFSSMKLDQSGIVLKFVGLKNFQEALFADPYYVRTIMESVRDMAIQVPIILIFSIFIALLLNQKFRGRTVARAIFFLPVIVVSGIILEILQADYLSNAIMSGSQSVGLMGGFNSYEMLYALGMPMELAETLVPVLYDVFNLIWNSGVQILLFLAGLQTVPPSLYEVARIEGATAWETFWKVTFPLISPMILMNIVYTVVDYFTTSMNPVIKMISQQSSNMKFEYAAGLSWMYLIVVLVLLGIIYWIINRRITYVVG